MVGIGVAGRGVDGLVHAAHLCIAGPVEPGQLTAVAQTVFPGVTGHQQPVDAAHEFPPADDLADKAFHGIQRRPAGVPGPYRFFTHLHGIQQAGVEIGGQDGMEQPVFIV